jgi:hypothetical protein
METKKAKISILLSRTRIKDMQILEFPLLNTFRRHPLERKKDESVSEWLHTKELENMSSN